MNAALRAVVRTAAGKDVETIGFYRGWQGVVDGNTTPLSSIDVGGIINRGGTMLGTARCPAFRQYSGRVMGHKQLQAAGIEGLIVIGGDGSLTGAKVLAEEFDFPVIGIPASIDNDIPGTDYSIGFDTAINTAVDAIDKVRDTAFSHERIFVVEVMGRNNGFIALEVALACGAEALLVPEVPYALNEVRASLQKMREKGKRSSIVIVAEGAGGSRMVGENLSQVEGFEVRESVLGHIQRGGSPSAYDRVLALRMGQSAVDLLLSGETRKMVGMVNRKTVTQDLAEILSEASAKSLDADEIALFNSMSQ
jgi:6-phosphofructokinase 1